MAKFIDLLRRLGIFRSGSTKATYRNATERPIELQQDEIFRADADLVTPTKPGKHKP